MINRDLRKRHIIACRPKGPYRVWIKFEDGLEGELDLKEYLLVPAFAETWTSVEEFNRVRIDRVTQTITWGKEGEEVDINPAYLRDEILKKRSDSIDSGPNTT